MGIKRGRSLLFCEPVTTTRGRSATRLRPIKFEQLICSGSRAVRLVRIANIANHFESAKNSIKKGRTRRMAVKLIRFMYASGPYFQ